MGNLAQNCAKICYFNFPAGILLSEFTCKGKLLQFDEIFYQILREFVIEKSSRFPHCETRSGMNYFSFQFYVKAIWNWKWTTYSIWIFANFSPFWRIFSVKLTAKWMNFSINEFPYSEKIMILREINSYHFSLPNMFANISTLIWFFYW